MYYSLRGVSTAILPKIPDTYILTLSKKLLSFILIVRNYYEIMIHIFNWWAAVRFFFLIRFTKIWLYVFNELKNY